MTRARTPRRPLLHRLRSSPDEDRQPLWQTIRRNQIFRVILAVLVVWVVGILGIHLAERGAEFAVRDLERVVFQRLGPAVHRPDEAPKTTIGRLISMILLGLGVGLAGLFTGSVASILVAQNLRKRDVSNFEMEDHLILCNWSERGLPWIREVHSKIIQDKRPAVVIIHDSPEAIDLPDKQDEPAFNDVYIVKGDPSNEVILRRARVPRAHSVVILSDDRQGEHADGEDRCPHCARDPQYLQGETTTSPSRCHQRQQRHHHCSAAPTIISSDELGLRLLATRRRVPGMTRVYQKLSTRSAGMPTKMYLFPVTEKDSSAATSSSSPACSSAIETTNDPAC